MNKIKITAVLIISLFIGMSVASATVTIDGRIKNEIGMWDVTPHIEIDNQSITLNVDVEGEGENATYTVNDSLFIELNNTLASSKDNYVLPRGIFYGVFFHRKLADILPLMDGTGRGILERILPLHNIGGAQVVDSMLGKMVNNITIPVEYRISNTTAEQGETLTMSIFVMGMLPGKTDGITEDLDFIAKKQITLEITYD